MCSEWLAERLRQRESAVHGMVSRLSAAGLVERNRSSTDGRAWAVHLTPRGRDALSAMDAALDTLNEVIERAVGARSVDAFVDALEAIASIAGHTGTTS
jgi:DNA-binding MarR family transcriptional regulator